MKVWPVSEGSYSDYRVLGLFATEELAAAYAASDGRDVESPMDVRESLPEPIECVGLHADVYETRTEERETSDLFFPGVDHDEPPAFYSNQHVYAWSPDSAHVSIWVRGTDQERVRKVYSEMKAQATADHRTLVVAEVLKSQAEVERIRAKAPAPVVAYAPIDGAGTLIGAYEPPDWSAYFTRSSHQTPTPTPID